MLCSGAIFHLSRCHTWPRPSSTEYSGITTCSMFIKELHKSNILCLAKAIKYRCSGITTCSMFIKNFTKATYYAWPRPSSTGCSGITKCPMFIKEAHNSNISLKQVLCLANAIKYRVLRHNQMSNVYKRISQEQHFTEAWVLCLAKAIKCCVIRHNN